MQKLSTRAANVSFAASVLRTAPNGGQYLEVAVNPSLHVVATTSDGRTYARLSDQCQPVTGEDLRRLVYEKSGLQWEIRPVPDVQLADLAATEIRYFVDRVRAAGKVSPFVLAKSDAESCSTTSGWWMPTARPPTWVCSGWVPPPSAPA